MKEVYLKLGDDGKWRFVYVDNSNGQVKYYGYAKDFQKKELNAQELVDSV